MATSVLVHFKHTRRCITALNENVPQAVVVFKLFVCL